MSNILIRVGPGMMGKSRKVLLAVALGTGAGGGRGRMKAKGMELLALKKEKLKPLEKWPPWIL
jgi:hypothetical protein